MNFEKFFELARQRGITESQIIISESKSTKITLFHHEIDSYKIAETQSLTVIGVYDGKLGSASTEKLDQSSFDYLINQVILTATYSEKPCKIGLFKGAERYKKANTFNKELSNTPIQKKISDLKALENSIYDYDSRVTDAPSVTYSEGEGKSEIFNSSGLHLKTKQNFYYFMAGAVAREGEETKTYYKVHFGQDYSTFKPKEFVDELVSEALKKFGGKPCESGKYPTVLKKDIMSDLIDYFLDNVIAENVQKKSSSLAGKVGTKIASSKLTIEEKPLVKNMFFHPFDDELVPSQNKAIIKNGVLMTYLYNRETAEIDGVESTGNGVWTGSRFDTGTTNLYIKPGKKSFDEMISQIKNGVYITEIAGLGTGMNSSSGDFSCQAEGYMIEEGKLTKPLSLITLSGNLFRLLKDIKEFDSNNEIDLSGTSVGDVYIKSLNIGGN